MRGTKAKLLRKQAGVTSASTYEPIKIHAKAFKGVGFEVNGLPKQEVHPVINPIRLAEGSARQTYQRSKHR